MKSFETRVFTYRSYSPPTVYKGSVNIVSFTLVRNSIMIVNRTILTAKLQWLLLKTYRMMMRLGHFCDICDIASACHFCDIAYAFASSSSTRFSVVKASA